MLKVDEIDCLTKNGNALHTIKICTRCIRLDSRWDFLHLAHILTDAMMSLIVRNYRTRFVVCIASLYKKIGGDI
jgi:hypothetical protein